jgi:hypothetical protein
MAAEALVGCTNARAVTCGRGWRSPCCALRLLSAYSPMPRSCALPPGPQDLDSLDAAPALAAAKQQSFTLKLEVNHDQIAEDKVRSPIANCGARTYRIRRGEFAAVAAPNRLKSLVLFGAGHYNDPPRPQVPPQRCPHMLPPLGPALPARTPPVLCSRANKQDSVRRWWAAELVSACC